MKMDRFAKLHKSKPAKFYDLDKKRQEATLELHKRRREIRTENFNSRRNIPKTFSEKENDQPFNTGLDRKLALKKYQRKKEFHKNKDIKKPPFVVGIPHHGSSPALKNITNDEADTCNHTLKNETVSFQPPRVFSTKKLTSPHTPTVLKRSLQKTKVASKPSHSIKCNLYAEQKKLKEKGYPRYSDEILAVPLSSEHNVSIDNLKDHGKSVVTNNKGKVKSSDPEGLETSSDTESYLVQLLAVVDFQEGEQEKSVGSNAVYSACSSRPNYENIPETIGAKFQRSRLEKERSRLKGLAQEWRGILQRSVNLPSDTVDEIDSVIGQTHLLIDGKFEQFHKLIEDHEKKSGNGNEIVTSNDLNGFWDMMYLQVSNLNKRYTYLDNLKNNKWLKQGQATKKKIRRPKIALQAEQTSSTTGLKDTWLESVTQPTNEVRTPSRKSWRLEGRTPTPSKLARCIVCQSPLNTNHNCVKEAKYNRPAKTFTEKTTQLPPKPEQKKTISKTFLTNSLIDPSNLEVKENITNSLNSDNPITPLRRSERKCTKVLDKLGRPGAGVTEVDVFQQPLRPQRNEKKQAARSVNFNSNVEEKTSKKRPPTPFVKRRGRKCEYAEDSS